MVRPLISVGTSRGGTTFFARMLSNHPSVHVASDPFLPLFRSLRTAVIRAECDPSYDAAQPLEDYYYTTARRAMFRAMQTSTLDRALPDGEIATLRSQCAARMGLAAKELVPYLHLLRGASYREAFASGFDLLAAAYGAADGSWVGFNDNWVAEFLPLLTRAFPESRCVVILRDPRAAIASAMKLRERKPEKAHLVPPVLAFARHWRKHAAFAWMLPRDPSLRGRVHVLRYEDCCTHPEQTLRALCAFLDIAFDPVMLDTNRFRPLDGQRWTGHSNFDVPTTGIYTESITAWQSYLAPHVVESIEVLCGPEMCLFGYDPVQYGGGLPSGQVYQHLVADDAGASGWRNARDAWDVEWARELFRQQMLRVDRSVIAPHIAEQYFLFADVFDACRALPSSVRPTLVADHAPRA